MSSNFFLIDFNLPGLVKKLKKEYGNKIGLVVVDDYHAPSFHPDNSVYKEQLQKNLVFNIFKKVCYNFDLFLNLTNIIIILYIIFSCFILILFLGPMGWLLLLAKRKIGQHKKRNTC